MQKKLRVRRKTILPRRHSRGASRLRLGIRIAFLGGGLAGLWGGITWWQITRSPPETGAKADVAIVLGAATWNGEPSPVFRERIRHAIHLYHAGRVHTLLFTGGTGPGEPLSEAAAGRALALARGVPADALLIEDGSTRTRDSLANARDIMTREQLRSALLVSDPLHLKRTTAMARALGMTVNPSATTTSAFRSPEARRKQAYRETKWLMLFHLRQLLT